MPRKKMAARRLNVVFEPDDGGWHVFVPDVRGCRSHGRSIAEARRNIREALSLCDDELDDAPGVAKTAEFNEDVRVPKGARRAVDRALRARAEAHRKEREAAQSAAECAKALREAGLSLRDVGELLHLSHQRIKQLIDAQ